MNFDRLILTTRKGCPTWCVRFEGEHAARVIDLFGSDTIETPFDWRATPCSVAMAKIAALNPGVTVGHEWGPTEVRA